MNNCGWYIIPFTIKDGCSEKLNKYLSNNYKKSFEFSTSKYLFSYIDELFNGKNARVKTFNISVENVKFDYNFRYINADQIAFDRISVVIFSDYLGFIYFKVDYKDLTADEILNVSYYLKKDWSQKTSDYKFSFYEISKNLLNEDYVDLFFYSTSDVANTCSIFQKVFFDCDKNSPEAINQYYAIGRGYDSSYIMSDTTYDESDVDIKFCPYSYMEWRGCQNVLAAFPNTYGLNKEEKYGSYSYLTTYFSNSFEGDYLAMYLFLLNQRYSLMYLLSKLTTTDDESEMDEIEEMLKDFKLCYSFKVVSNEMTYQNLYDKIYKVMDIERLINDAQDASERLDLKARRDDEIREKQTNKLLFVVGLLAIGSALIDFADYIDRLFGKVPDASPLGTWISLAISVAVVILGVVLVFKRDKNYKHK